MVLFALTLIQINKLQHYLLWDFIYIRVGESKLEAKLDVGDIGREDSPIVKEFAWISCNVLVNRDHSSGRGDASC